MKEEDRLFHILQGWPLTSKQAARMGSPCFQETFKCTRVMASILLVTGASPFASWKQGLGIEDLVWTWSSLPTETPSQAPPLYCSMGPLLPRCFLYCGRSLVGSLLLFYPAQELQAYDKSPWCTMKDDNKSLAYLSWPYLTTRCCCGKSGFSKCIRNSTFGSRFLLFSEVVWSP